MQIRFVKCRETAEMPSRATPYSAGYDLYAANETPIVIHPGEICRIPIGIAIEPERTDIGLMIFPRSGLATKYGITLANAVGLVDADYRGEIQTPLINHGTAPFTVSCGMRVAQLVAIPVLSQEWIPAETLNETERSTGGFGSTGIGDSASL